MPVDTPTLQRSLRGVFDARVFNHGDYNLVYGQPSGGQLPLVIGYRHSPLEMLLCPVDPVEAVAAEVHAGAPGESDVPEAEPGSASVGVESVALANVATVADTGTGYQVETVTGFRTWFEVTDRPQIPVGEAADDGVAVLDQADDAADFHAFMTAFMDELDRLYDIPSPDPGEADLHSPG